MPTGFQALDQGTPELNPGMSTEDKMGEILSKFVMLLESLKYVLSNLGSENFNEAGLAEITEPITGLITDIEGNVAELALTSMGLQFDVSNIEGDLTSLSVTVEGLMVADETGSYTIIDGGKMESRSVGGYYVSVHDGTIELYAEPYDPSTSLPKASFNIYSGSVILQNMFSDFPLKIFGVGNMSIDASGRVYIGTSAAASGNVDIGKTGGTVNLLGTVLKNGNPIGAAVFT